jgi:molybdopterin molybdotransferase
LFTGETTLRLSKSGSFRDSADVLELEDALSQMLAALPMPETERIQLSVAHERILAEPINARINVPPFDNSAMDGYAVRATDVAKASAAAPVLLRVRGKVAAGETASTQIASGECMRLFTGSPVPRGADAVVMQEDTKPDPGAPDGILICDSARPGENVRRRGSDMQQGAMLAKAGDALTAGRIGLLAACGIGDVTVGKRPRVGLLATGSELREAGQPLEPGQIYESNRSMLAALVERTGAIPQGYPLVMDSLAATQQALETALRECDAVVTSGGVSVGEMDFVKAAFEGLGGELQFWKVAIRPGKPFVFGRCRGKLLFGLPGNPVSAFVTYLVLVRPALLRCQGATTISLPTQPGALAEPLANPGDRRHFMRVRLDDSGKVHSAGQQASHALLALAVSQGLVDVPPKTTLVAGKIVPVLRWQ